LITKALTFAPEGFDCREESIKLKGASGEIVFALIWLRLRALAESLPKP